MRNILLFCSLLFLTIVLMSNSMGRAAVGQEGNTGAPGDDAQTCAKCHASFDDKTQGIITVSNSNGTTVTEYIPGETYQVSLALSTTSSNEAYGFQMVSLIDADNTDTGGFSQPSSAAKLTNLNNRTYLEHKSLTGENSITVSWTAPKKGSGSVSFYSAFIAADGNSSTAGDFPGNTNFTISEKVETGVTSTKPLHISTFPNPASEVIMVDIPMNTPHTYTLRNTQGIVVQSNTIMDKQIYIESQINPGLYILTLNNVEQPDKFYTAKVVLN